MPDRKSDFIELAMHCEALKFGEFELKSGRTSPYFFNAGQFHDGAATAALGRHYARAIVESGLEYDVLFGPAYKGISLAAVTAAALWIEYERNVGWAYDRKEKKSHGEGGKLVGAPVQGRVLVIDDVITAGTAIRQAVELIESADATLAGVCVALDRQEVGQQGVSAIEEVEQQFKVPVISLITLDDLLKFLDEKPQMHELRKAVKAYRNRFGVSA